MTTLVDAPTRVDGVQLIGEMVGSGYRTPPALVRRADGQVLQLTPMLYLVLSAVDGRRTHAEIAEVVGRTLGRTLPEEGVRQLVDGHLRPLGLLRRPDGTEPEVKQSNPLLALRPKVAVTNPRVTRRLTDPFRVLFHPLLMVSVVVAFVVVVAWVFFERGLGASAYDAFQRPHLLLLVFAVSVLSGGFHEFGHAAAARYSGAQPGAMGAGLYLVWPAFYTDVTDSYRLGRGGRIRTDLGGLYFNAIVAVLTFGWWWWSGWEALLLLVATQVLQMVQQMLPLLRYDGYHLLADLAGVPDLYHRIRPTLLGLLPHRWRSPENAMLKPWSRAVITLWVLVTVPMMVLMLLAMITAVPRLLGSAGQVIGEDLAAVGRAWSDGNVIDVGGNTVQVLGVVLPLLGCALILSRLGFKFFWGLTSWSRGSLTRRGVATVVGATALTVLFWSWWPNPGTYRPIEAGERGLLTAVMPGSDASDDARLASGTAALSGRAATARLASDEPLVATFEKGRPLPTEEHPSLAMVLVPSESAASDEPGGSPDDGPPGEASGSPDGTWVFPFDKPLPPAEGDNQALAVATEDGSISYDVAFALVWAEGDEVLNVNEAHAYASCSNCVAVAVAFQVVLVMDDARVIVPQNLAVAANYDCYECITAAIASQLVLSVQGEPGEEQLQALTEVWGRLIEFARSLATHTVAEITAQLEQFKAEITAIMHQAPSAGTTPAPSEQPSSAATAGADGTADPTQSAPSPSPAAASPSSEDSSGSATSSEPAPADSPPASSVETPSGSATDAPPPTTSAPSSPAPETSSTTTP